MIDPADSVELKPFEFLSPYPEITGLYRMDILCGVRNPCRENPAGCFPGTAVFAVFKNILAFCLSLPGTAAHRLRLEGKRTNPPGPREGDGYKAVRY